MTAKCQACRVGVPLIGTPMGAPDDPLGVCSICSSLTCGQHGHRDPSAHFNCIQCDLALQASSAAWISWLQNGQQAAPPPVPNAPRGNGPTAADLRTLLPDGWHGFVVSFDDWAVRRPFYQRLIALIRQDLDRMVSRLNEVATNGAPWHEPAPTGKDVDRVAAFADLWGQLTADGKGLLAAAFVLCLVMNLPAWSLPPVLQSIAKIAFLQLRSDFPEPGQEIPFEEYRYR